MHSNAEADIGDAISGFQHRWLKTESDWNDNARRFFDAEYVQPVFSETPQLAQQIRQLTDIFEQARREVE
jgi:hypothetical protein